MLVPHASLPPRHYTPIVASQPAPKIAQRRRQQSQANRLAKQFVAKTIATNQTETAIAPPENIPTTPNRAQAADKAILTPSTPAKSGQNPNVIASPGPATKVAIQTPTVQPTTQPQSDNQQLANPTSNAITEPSQAATKQAALFQKIFGGGRATSRTNVMVPWWVNDQPQGNILVTLRPGQAFAVKFVAKDFLAASTNFVRPDIQAKLAQAVEQNGFLSSEALRQLGLEVIFDNQRLELRIQVPPAQRKTQRSNLGKAQSENFKDALKPSNVSGYLNIRGNQTFDWLGSSTRASGRQPLQFALDGAINLGGWVLESDAQFTEGNQWERGNIRLLHDDTKRALRYAIGDIAPPATGYQTSPSMLGIAVARNYNLQPDQVTRPINQFQFFLERKSRVDVFNNGELLQTLTLEAGTQDLRDLPLGAGVSDVQLVVTNDLGQVQRLDFATATARNLLAPGLQQFAYSLGVPSEQQNGRFDYDWEQPTLTLAYRWGANPTFTTGSYLQANFQSQLLGWEGYLATPIGLWNWDTAVSHHNSQGTGLAARLRYDFIKLGDNNPTRRTFGFSAEYRGRNFMSLGDTEPKNETWLDLNAYYKQKLFHAVDATIEGRYQLSRTQNNAYRIALGLSHNISNQLSITAKLSHRQLQGGNNDQRIAVNINWRRSSGNQAFRTNSAFSNQASTTHQLDWSYNSPNPIQGLKSNIGFNVNDQGTDINSRLSFPSYRFNLELAHSGSLLRQDSATQKQETQLNFGSAIVFADGHWAFSRPINGSFALVVPHKNLKQQRIGINADGRGGYAAVAKGATAVIPGLPSYQLSTVRLEAPNLPIGLDIGKSSTKLLPGYKTGTLIKVGNDANVFLRGQLRDANGEPISYGSGTIVSQSDSQWKSVTLFTNKTGRFALLGFKPGKYEIQLNVPTQARILFDIPEDANGIYTIDNLKVLASPENASE
ncbi:fimbria/pilus outer membrane usher protein [filamentous cyanobacterium LEGE 11480]|uniref:Fimbria/pilus outer membrane usher protein n=1 Tax=Romeriopsis navalis LEGE 11480 TaxID=2777977 RepID=A0A928VN92_9CYAN|nr:fimbria/pilus outer membrane usher protein [Romeriopsis navalis]MBE9029816.1 fimbria/pilus outer membrane usher protein [Romeriopsis navalis LEGE 11480]